MASRKRKLALTEDWKERISAGVIVDRLLKHVSGDLELSSTQISAANILLKKIIPDLSSANINQKLSGLVNVKGVLTVVPARDKLPSSDT